MYFLDILQYSVAKLACIAYYDMHWHSPCSNLRSSKACPCYRQPQSAPLARAFFNAADCSCITGTGLQAGT
jgi:hypothetical protein